MASLSRIGRRRAPSRYTVRRTCADTALTFPGRTPSRTDTSTGATGGGHDSGVELGTRLHVRDVDTFDDLCDVTAPGPVEPGDVVATAEHVYRVEVVLEPPPGAPVTPVLARRTSS
jgi:hypothetical protein